jgi:magnesium-transporting ATPase (P-type)
MPDSHNSEQQERFQSYLHIHLKEEERSLPQKEQVQILQKKNRKQSWFLGINMAAILFFGYSFYYGITQLSNTLLYILGGVFVINVVLIFYQKKQLNKLIEYLKSEQGNDVH